MSARCIQLCVVPLFTALLVQPITAWILVSPLSASTITTNQNRCVERCCPFKEPHGACVKPLILTQKTKSSKLTTRRMTGQSAGEDDINADRNLVLLHGLLRPSEDCKVNQMSGTELAYVGDVVYELFVRSRTVWPAKRTAELQKQAVALVRAEHQSKLLSILKEEFPMTEKEQQVLNRGRNAGSSRNNNRRDPAAYQDSTAFEAVLGYLYISNPRRCSELLEWIDQNIDAID